MKSTLVAGRASICLMAILAATALPAAAQRDVKEIDQAVLQQQKSLAELTSSVDDLKKQNEVLKKQNDALVTTMDDIAKKAAPVEAWIAIGTVGVVSVLMWGGVTIAREWKRPPQPESDPSRKIQEAVDRETKRINDAVDARIKAITDLFQGLRL
jgi:hypothetical protein